ncbi:flagellar biosynthesis regulator FlaF [Marivivens donghaensis]|nr:flagellar biosynthesis regulator FlaF [Marivivens donghaensis]
MNAIIQARMGYDPKTAVSRHPRSMERLLFGQITSRLSRAIAGTHRKALIEALHDNRKLWTTIAVDIASDDNGLPDQLRGQIFYLAEFTHHHSSLVLKDGADPAVLVDINRAVIAGLSSEAAA